MQVVFFKTDKLEGVKDQKKCLFTHLMGYIFARMERKFEGNCKIKDNDLSF